MKRAMMAAALVLAAGAQAGELKLEFKGKGMAGSKVRAAIYSANAPEQFPSEDKFYRAMVSEVATGDRLVMTVPDLPPGKYAVSAFADSNKNGKLDKNGLGMPTEIYGNSNDARGMFGPPEFSKAEFELGESPLSLTIHLH